MKYKVFIIYYLPAILWMVLIFAFSSLPSEQLPSEKIPILKFPYSDKIQHFFEYLILGILLSRALKKDKSPFIVGFLYAIFDETYQIFIPTRNFEISDLITDFLGIILGILIWNKFKK